MNTSAVVMLLIGAVGLWGGFAYFLWHAYKCGQQKQNV
ncbi:MetS family NSS transporter small subunit [Paludifilum halophilum]|nr:MetS family NSS transporter small subunit [Paludifilum halophilum]